MWLIDRIVANGRERLDACLASGIVVSAGEAISFRHELAREAVISAVSDHRKVAMHGAILDALISSPEGEPDLARLAHHAVGAAEASAVVWFVPVAAARASELGAHREAAVLYDWALRFADDLPLEARARLSERRAAECYCYTDFTSAEAAQRQAVAGYEQLGDELRHGAALNWLSHLLWEVGSLPEAQRMALESVAQLERLAAGSQLVAAYCGMAELLLAAEDPDGARKWAVRADKLAREIGHGPATVVALMMLGWVEFFAGENAGLAKLERCVEIAEDAGLHELMGITHVVIARTAARRRMNEAATLAETLMVEPCPISRNHGLVALAMVRARRGDPDPWTFLDEALAVAPPRQELQWIGPVAAARAEAAWLESPRRDRPRPRAGVGIPDAPRQSLRHRTHILVLARGSRRGRVPPFIDGDPYLLEIAGDWALASEAWRTLGCPYEAAPALAAADDEQPLRRALDELQALGARPAAAIIARERRK